MTTKIKTLFPIVAYFLLSACSSMQANKADKSATSAQDSAVESQRTCPSGKIKPQIKANYVHLHLRVPTCIPPLIYPKILQREGVHGSVLLALDIGPSGKVLRAWVKHDYSGGWLDGVAIESVKRFRFEPATHETRGQLQMVVYKVRRGPCMFGKGGKAMPYRYRHLRGLQGRIPICIPYFYYPQNLLSKGLSAKVAMSVDISASGKVLRVRVLSDTSGGLASKGAVKYMKGWKFKPANHETHDFEYGVKYQILK